MMILCMDFGAKPNQKAFNKISNFIRFTILFFAKNSNSHAVRARFNSIGDHTENLTIIAPIKINSYWK